MPKHSEFKDRWIEKSITELGLEIKHLSAEQIKTREMVARLDERLGAKAASSGGIVGGIISGIITGFGLLFHKS